MTSGSIPAGPGLRGGGWLIEPPAPAEVFTPERLTEDQRLIARTVSDFVASDVMPVVDRLEQKDWALTRELLRKSAALGFTGIDVPDDYGGVHVDTATSMIVSQGLASPASFAATFGAHVNLTILPLTLFGTEDQKRRYLPRLLSGELLGGYCLSEPSAGSDALGGRTRADRTADGFVLNGEKMWITNGGIADVFIVFAKVGGERFSAFIVEREFGGVTSGREEHKLGLHGSSTTSVTFRDTPVPAGNLLGEEGRGHKIAFNVLNLARLKLGAICAGVAKRAVGEAAQYAAARRQFGQPIANFGAIRHKVGGMVAQTYAADAIAYRTVGMIDKRIKASGAWSPSNLLGALEEFAIEASIAKVAGSETLDRVLDENIQIHGGNGFVRDYPAERHYRDARVNRIFEGTNEINRLLIPGLITRRAAAGAFPMSLAFDRRQNTEGPAAMAGPLAAEVRAAGAFKYTALSVLRKAIAVFGDRLSEEQEVLLYAADILIDAYSAESAVLRAAAASGGPAADIHLDAARVFVHDAALRVAAAARQALSAMTANEEEFATFTAAVQPPLLNTVSLRRRLAAETVARGAYPF